MSTQLISSTRILLLLVILLFSATVFSATAGEAHQGPGDVVAAPLYISLDIHRNDLTLVTHFRELSSTVGPFEKKWFAERFERLYQILEGRETRRIERLQSIIRELSTALVVPIEPQIDLCSEVAVILDSAPLEIALDIQAIVAVRFFCRSLFPIDSGRPVTRSSSSNSGGQRS